MTAERVIYVDARPEIRGCIRPVEHGYKLCEYIVSRHDSGAKVVPVRPESADDQKDGHAREQKSTCPEIIILVLEKEVDHHYRDIGKPEQVGDNEYFQKGDEVVRPVMNQSVMACHRFFQIGKPV